VSPSNHSKISTPGSTTWPWATITSATNYPPPSRGSSTRAAPKTGTPRRSASKKATTSSRCNRTAHSIISTTARGNAPTTGGKWEADLSGVRNAAEADARIHRYIEAQAKKAKPEAIVELKLTGRTEGGDIQIDVHQLEIDLRDLTKCVCARVLRQTTTAETDIHIASGERFDPKEVEHDVLTQALVGRFPGFKPAAATETARLVVDLKNDLLKDDQPEHVLVKIRRIVAGLPKTEAQT
jgi:hypothetical protein